MEAPENPTEKTANKKTPPTPKKKKSKNAKRFTDEQIKSLESIFKLESKLETGKKLKIAKELGLQPRQVAIWFQNKRARWKSKQIEQEYKVLKANYDNLYLRFQSLKREKQSLQTELKELSDVINNPGNGHCRSRGKSIDTGTAGCEEKSSSQNEAMHDIHGLKDSFKMVEEEAVVSLSDQRQISPLASPDTWSNLCSGGVFLDQSCESNWWENVQI